MDPAGLCPSISWRDGNPYHRRHKWRGSKGARHGYERCSKVRGDGHGWGHSAPRVMGLKAGNRVMRVRKGYGKRREGRSVPRAPYNHNSFLMKVRRAGGLASLASPSPSPSPSPVLSSPACSSFGLGSYGSPGVNQNDYGYGSMTGLIYLRAIEDEDQLSGSTVENSFADDVHVEQAPVSSAESGQMLEQRLDQDVSRFEMAPLPERASEYQMEQRAMRQDVCIAHLEDENLLLKERLCLLEQDVGMLWQRVQAGERCSVHESDENDDTQSCFGM